VGTRPWAAASSAMIVSPWEQASQIESEPPQSKTPARGSSSRVSMRPGVSGVKSVVLGRVGHRPAVEGQGGP